MHTVIMAGGRGRRLAPYTINFPKPLVPVGEMPILEIVLRQLKIAGCETATLAVGHLAELIMAYFGKGEQIGVDLKYSGEKEPLGTVGPLALMEDLPENFLVMNGDVLTTLDYRELYEYHLQNECDLTIACHRCSTKIDLGIVEFDERLEVTGYREKPRLPYDVSMGVYAFNRKALDIVPAGEYYDLPTLVLKFIELGRKVKVYMSDAMWLDIGRVEDYASASAVFEEHRDLFLPEPQLANGTPKN
ncbi:sugar phosphate nucleotidyltransferase [Bremerella sp. JC817]|uniref:sugar phosphate nucleotidyltransferase n=1 Tax=Bremerella sp. JC817 TaxID=3231756 RepID=UPI003458BDAE